MALMYMAATAMPYSGSYLMHARTKGSKNGISNTPGYVAVGDRAEGRLVNGRYVYDTPQTTNTPKTLAKRAQNRASGASSNSGRRVSNYELAARNYMLGNRSAARRYLGNTGIGRAATTTARNVSTAAQNVSRTASRTANNVANWVTGDYARNRIEQARQNNDREAMAYWQRQYDRTLPGIIDKVKDVGSETWNSVKKGATEAFNKGKDFVTGLLGNVRSAVGRKWREFQDWMISTERGRRIEEWGEELVRKAIRFSDSVRSGVNRASNWATGDYARNQLQIARNANDREGMAYWQNQLDQTLPGIANRAGQAVSNVASNAGTAISGVLDAASQRVGSTLTAIGNAFTGNSGSTFVNATNANGDVFRIEYKPDGTIASVTPYDLSVNSIGINLGKKK